MFHWLRISLTGRLALQQKKREEEKSYGAIDYDAPVESGSTTIGLGTNVLLFRSWHIPILIQLNSFLHMATNRFINLIDWNWSGCYCIWTRICTWWLSSLWKVDSRASIYAGYLSSNISHHFRPGFLSYSIQRLQSFMIFVAYFFLFPSSLLSIYPNGSVLVPLRRLPARVKELLKMRELTSW